jgi:ferredoxin
MHAPDVFKIDDDGLMTVQTPAVDGSRRAEIEEAAMSCPTQSIRIVDDDPTSGDDRCD